MHLLTHVSSHLDFHVHNSASQYVLLDNALSKSFTNRHAFGLEVPILAITTSSTINHHNISKQTEQQSIVATLCLHHHKQTNQTITTRLYTVRNHTTSSNTHATSHTPSDIIYLHSIIPSHDDRNRSQSQYRSQSRSRTYTAIDSIMQDLLQLTTPSSTLTPAQTNANPQELGILHKCLHTNQTKRDVATKPTTRRHYTNKQSSSEKLLLS